MIKGSKGIIDTCMQFDVLPRVRRKLWTIIISGHESPTVFTEHATDFTATYGDVGY